MSSSSSSRMSNELPSSLSSAEIFCSSSSPDVRSLPDMTRPTPPYFPETDSCISCASFFPSNSVYGSKDLSIPDIAVSNSFSVSTLSTYPLSKSLNIVSKRVTGWVILSLPYPSEKTGNINADTLITAPAMKLNDIVRRVGKMSFNLSIKSIMGWGKRSDIFSNINAKNSCTFSITSLIGDGRSIFGIQLTSSSSSLSFLFFFKT
mmetsp:Transcript_50870/g.59440  ORF Transcript_50870/g.59440 Transcript_50870/m.59440 type:complete len:205 (-) Transcript_50870:87-701(-)